MNSRFLKALGDVGLVTKGLEDALFAAVEGEMIVDRRIREIDVCRMRRYPSQNERAFE